MPVLNDKKVESAKISSAELAKELNKMILKIYGKYLNEKGTGVDYSGVSKDPLFLNEYMEKASQLQHANMHEIVEMSEDARKAFFMNLYNMMVIHGKAVGVSKMGFFSSTCYNIGGHKFSCDDVEHGILRCNSKNTGFFASRPFSDSDPRIKFCMKKKDPRIHFALVCGARSCPPIRIYDENNIENALELAAKNFISNNITINAQKKKVKLSKLFDWYGCDFGSSKDQVCSYVLRYLDGENAEALKLATNGHYSLSYEKYDWKSNSLDH